MGKKNILHNYSFLIMCFCQVKKDFIGVEYCFGGVLKKPWNFYFLFFMQMFDNHEFQIFKNIYLC